MCLANPKISFGFEVVFNFDKNEVIFHFENIEVVFHFWKSLGCIRYDNLFWENSNRTKNGYFLIYFILFYYY